MDTVGQMILYDSEYGLSLSFRKLVEERMKAAYRFSYHPLLVSFFRAAFFQVPFCLEDPFLPGVAFTR